MLTADGLPKQFLHQSCHRQGIFALQNSRLLTRPFAFELKTLIPERKNDEIHPSFDQQGGDLAQAFAVTVLHRYILPKVIP